MARGRTLNLNDVDVNINSIIRSVAKEIGAEINAAFRSTILDFYQSYKPIRYKRTLSLFDASEGVGGKRKYLKQVSTRLYECGIRVGEEYIDGDPYASQHHARSMDGLVNKGWVVPRAFDEGIHGYCSEDKFLYSNGFTYRTIPPIAKPIPHANMDKRCEKIFSTIKRRTRAALKKY